MKTKLITLVDYHRLLSRLNWVPSVDNLSVMEKELYITLQTAKTISQHNVPKTVITMNSTVRLRELLSQNEIELTITYPGNENCRKNRISILSPIGIALIGQQKGNQVSWKVPGGLGHFQIIDIPYQPEAAGDYSL